MVATEYRIIVHITQEIIHPAHIPFEIKAEATLVKIASHLGPRRGLLGNQKRAVFAFFIRCV